MKRANARAAAIAAAVLFSTGGAAIKTGAFSAAQVSAVRSGVAALALFGWLWYERNAVSAPPRAVALHRISRVVAVGAVYAATLTLFVVSTRLTTAANAIFLQATAPVFILVLAPWLLRERVTRGDAAYLAAVGAGMALCFAGRPAATATAPDPATGNLLGLACAVVWALTLIGLRHLQRERASAVDAPAHEIVGLHAVIAGNAVACLIALPWALPLPQASAGEWSVLLYLGVFQIGLAYVCLTTAMRTLPALEISLLLLLEPVLNPVWTWLIRGEQPGGWVLAGGAFIVAATGVRAWSARRI
jgi:drug/metabolite transporter, DME family